ncbi:MAG: UDP-glucose/GDP-mannose dehydrogenase family protein [Spirochaetaceae bacterium]|nr:UDP-glucose/GDP-mannose dehydrogenase family protein [Spirochaetaceae bacterium]
MNLAVAGVGYVGLVSGSCLADFGNNVVCVDKDAAKIALLRGGKIPIYESGLDELVARNTAEGRLAFSSDLSAAVKKSDAVFIAVGTPPREDGSANLAYVEDVAREIGRAIEKYTVIVDKSTVPVGAGQQVKAWIKEELDRRGADIPFDVVSNPEFLREGTAVYDFTHPNRVVVGAESDRARKVMKSAYRPFHLSETPYIETTLESAEMIKYSSNAFLAVKISFINEIAALCEKAGANVEEVALGMGLDKRIGRDFLKAGPGYGGSCFPKDTMAIASMARNHGERLSIVEATIEANKKQRHKMLEKIETGLGGKGADGGKGSIKGKTFAVMGLAFKNNTNDIRESPAIEICEKLLEAGAVLRAWDPAAQREAGDRLARFGGSVYFAKNEYDIFDKADAFVLLTEWNQAGNLDLEKIKNLMKAPVFFDLRNMYKRAEAEAAGFQYFSVGR